MGINGYIFKGDQSDKWILLPSEKGPTLKGKNLLPIGANSFLLEEIPFRSELVCRNANRKSQKLDCVEVLRPSQPSGIMSSAVSLPNHTFTGQA